MDLRRYLDTFDDVFKAASLFASDVQDLMHAENIDLDIQTTLPLRRISKKPKKHDQLCEDEELSKTLWDEHISSRQHKQDSDSQSDEENDEDVLDLDQAAKDAMCFSGSGLDSWASGLRLATRALTTQSDPASDNAMMRSTMERDRPKGAC
ncbi:hypothetical protein EVAR_78253_1 [Eumeta japonica]|uniref:Uncharacterized protein n=1 Tax=Eumeta variegata TaxID=151549 RepID=A0A4C1T2X4_EUMVA|nr:hypothetical protein EVAR_78253_1 [Eumeta japonica]